MLNPRLNPLCIMRRANGHHRQTRACSIKGANQRLSVTTVNSAGETVTTHRDGKATTVMPDGTIYHDE